MLIKIQVTNEYIAHGSYENPRCCPVALGMKHCSCTGVEVRTRSMEFGYDGENYSFKNSPKLAEWIHNFDEHHKATPITVVLDTHRRLAFVEGEY